MGIFGVCFFLVCCVMCVEFVDIEVFFDVILDVLFFMKDC